MTRAALPPGQFELSSFPRFGLSQFANRIINPPAEFKLELSGDVEQPKNIGWDELSQLPRVEQQSDFHCVTTWSKRNLKWSGFRFKDFYEQILVPTIHPKPTARMVVFRCLDGYRTTLPLEDALASDVLLADRLDGEPLSVEHGTPLRLVAAQHYGYKNPKYLRAIEVWPDDGTYRESAVRFMAHPRARVAYEERGQWVPGWLLRYLYRPLIHPTIRMFERGMRAYLEDRNSAQA
jgi:DMSO/TMAO reductase YedYZ molybdopterin-dependent catalytic subunit